MKKIQTAEGAAKRGRTAFSHPKRQTLPAVLIAGLLLLQGGDGLFAADRHFPKGIEENTADARRIRRSETVTLSKETLLDKIKGGWAGQTIGCTYGGPTEFHFRGTMIQDYIPIKYEPGRVKWYYENGPGLYDDIYMDLTFVDVFDRYGLDAPVEKFAQAFAHAEYPLWHANQAARYNILNGILPPMSGHWENNPHADDIDFQIEADFAGLMSPGMIRTATAFADEIGHIMNCGDGWYGGVMVAAMYSQAFIRDDVETVVREALKVIPKESRYYRCMADVLRWHERYPDDWKQTWAECEKKWSEDIACPDGVFLPFNIDAVINSAYVLIGLLYGDGDFFKTMDIATRCGQDSDCNPATAAGILGTLLGYSRIPEKWMANIREVEDLNFAYTDISLNKAYRMSYEQALEVIRRQGGTVGDQEVTIRCQKPETVRFEECFPNLFPVDRIERKQSLAEPVTFEFEGRGYLADYRLNTEDKGYVAKVAVRIDGGEEEIVRLPVLYRERRDELHYRYNLPEGRHKVCLKWLNPEKGVRLETTAWIVYASGARTEERRKGK